MSTATEEDTVETENESSLLSGIKTDEPQDTRSCPHEHCHGSLSVENEDSNNERVICQSCRCTPDGVYFEPDVRGTNPRGNESETGLQAPFFEPNGPVRPTFNPNNSEWDSHLEFRNYGEREQYRVSGNVKMVGGFESAWPQEKTSRDDSLI